MTMVQHLRLWWEEEEDEGEGVSGEEESGGGEKTNLIEIRILLGVNN